MFIFKRSLWLLFRKVDGFGYILEVERTEPSFFFFFLARMGVEQMRISKMIPSVFIGAIG